MVTKMNPKDTSRLKKSEMTTLIGSQQADWDYLRSHYRELLEKYPKHWVILSEGKLVGAEKDPDELLKALDKVSKKDRLVYFLADPEEIMVL